jgi:hypothetical protein
VLDDAVLLELRLEVLPPAVCRSHQARAPTANRSLIARRRAPYHQSPHDRHRLCRRPPQSLAPIASGELPGSCRRACRASGEARRAAALVVARIESAPRAAVPAGMVSAVCVVSVARHPESLYPAIVRRHLDADAVPGNLHDPHANFVALTSLLVPAMPNDLLTDLEHVHVRRFRAARRGVALMSGLMLGTSPRSIH